MLDLLAQILTAAETLFLSFLAVFVRVGAVTMLMPGFGESFIPGRLRLAIALSFSMICAPFLAQDLATPPTDALGLILLILSEALAGLLLGLSVRIIVMALQLAGAFAAQSTSLVQMAGVAVTPDPLPALGNMLVLAGLTLALITDLHIQLVWMIVQSYEILPVGLLADSSSVADWGVAHGMAAIRLAFSLAAPFVIASLLYNLALGAMNRAMPQLMVAFVGAPAITAGTLVILMLASPFILATWLNAMGTTLETPLGGLP